MVIRENDQIFFAILEEQADRKAFLRIAEQVTRKLNVQFERQLHDFDSVFWDFHFEQQQFVLHFHELIGDIEIFTNKENGREGLERLVGQLIE